jgi:hypothetical protein|tara:strand:- start:629 stop:1084 length:456 start_codon:yes stop_codon:yes gene_type:complete
MFEIIASVLSGGATGIIGSLVGTVGRYVEKRQELKQIEIEFTQEIKLQELQISARSTELESEQAIALVKADSDIKTASYSHDASYGPTMPVIAAILRFVRPVLTFGLLGFSGYIFFVVHEDPQVVRELSNQIMFLTTTAVAWWFGDRSLRK